jgi:hypothetical protein
MNTGATENRRRCFESIKNDGLATVRSGPVPREYQVLPLCGPVPREYQCDGWDRCILDAGRILENSRLKNKVAFDINTEEKHKLVNYACD